MTRMTPYGEMTHTYRAFGTVSYHHRALGHLHAYLIWSVFDLPLAIGLGLGLALGLWLGLGLVLGLGSG